MISVGAQITYNYKFDFLLDEGFRIVLVIENRWTFSLTVFKFI